MITSAHLQNCQSHKDTIIHLHEGVNVFVGDTDAGKSALMRGLRYVLYNKNHKELLSHWGGVLQVELNIDSNKLIRKSDGKEIYILNDLELHSFGTKVPSEIEKVINMGEINNQEQIDSFFLLNETAGYVATYLNKIANLEQIDSTTKSIKSELNETKRLIEHKKEDLKKKAIELESFAFLSDFEKDLQDAELLQDDVEGIVVNLKIIRHLLGEIKQCKKEIKKNNNILNLKDDVYSALGLTNEIQILNVARNRLNGYLDSLSDIDTKTEELNNLLDLKDLVADALKLKTKQNDLQAKLDTFDDISDRISTINTRIENTQLEIAKDKEIYETELHKLGKCFFCGSKLK